MFFSMLIGLVGCYGVNETTSEIGVIDTYCIKENTWDIIMETYSTDNITDSVLLKGLKDFDNQVFESKVIFFSKDPVELIGIDKDYYSVRYVFNPTLSDKVLDGFSSKLTESEKNRISNRVQKLLIPFQCEEGKQKSYNLIDSRGSN